MGEQVLGFDGQPAGVTKVYTRETDHLRELRYRNVQTKQLHRVETTDEHLYWVQSREAWIRAGELAVGDVLALADNQFAKLENTHRREIDTVVYNFDVDGLQSYFANGALVYQQCGGETDQQVTEKLLRLQSERWQGSGLGDILDQFTPVEGR
jgi:intein/homing endonuclease